jgi:TPR repeat protein
MGGSSAYIANPPAPTARPRENVPATAETTPAKPPENGDANAPGTTESGTTNAPSSLSGASKGTPPPVTPLAGITPPASPEASPDAGQAEYLQAVQILRGRNAGVDTPEAVRLLWIAVEKGNPSAEVTLADLYWHGQGVARNCDQTRILLTAASRKGSAEAQKRLQQFQREGCE